MTYKSSARSSCPACHGTNCFPVRVVEVEEAAQHFVLREDDQERHQALARHICSLWNGRTCDIVECKACGFGFASPFQSGDSRFYELAYPTIGYPREKWEFTRTIQKLADLDTAGKSALEVAAGNGFFLDKIAGRFFNKPSITATEYNSRSIKVLQSKGYLAISQDVRADYFDDKHQAYDFVFMFQVIEHMANLDELFDRLYMILRPGGSVFITVPNRTWTAFEEATASLFIDMPPNHISRWTPKAFSAIGERVGLRMVASEFEPFDALAFLSFDLFLAHRHRSKNPTTLANLARRIPRGRLRKWSEGGLIALSAPLRLGAWATALPNRHGLGASLWVQLTRPQ